MTETAAPASPTDDTALTPEVLNAMAGGYGHTPDGCPVCATIPAHVVARNTL